MSKIRTAVLRVVAVALVVSGVSVAVHDSASAASTQKALHYWSHQTR